MSRYLIGLCVSSFLSYTIYTNWRSLKRRAVEGLGGELRDEGLGGIKSIAIGTGTLFVGYMVLDAYLSAKFASRLK